MGAKQESEELINALLPFTEQMLQRYGEFYPHGGYMQLDGKIVMVGAKDEVTDHPKSQDLISILENSLKDIAAHNPCKVAAIVFDVLVNLPKSDRKSDAIQVRVEHIDGYAAEVFFPYEIVNGQVVYGQTFAQQRNPEFFVSRPAGHRPKNLLQ